MSSASDAVSGVVDLMSCLVGAWDWSSGTAEVRDLVPHLVAVNIKC